MQEGVTEVSSETLTQRQREILQALADGRTYQEIASELHVNRITLFYHISRVRVRFDSPNTLHAVATAIRRGLID